MKFYFFLGVAFLGVFGFFTGDFFAFAAGLFAALFVVGFFFGVSFAFGLAEAAFLGEALFAVGGFFAGVAGFLGVEGGAAGEVAVVGFLATGFLADAAFLFFLPSLSRTEVLSFKEPDTPTPFTMSIFPSSRSRFRQSFVSLSCCRELMEKFSLISLMIAILDLPFLPVFFRTLITISLYTGWTEGFFTFFVLVLIFLSNQLLCCC